jgi:hypothetical protein
MISYTHRLNAFTKPTTWQLHEKGLIMTEEGGQEWKIPFKNITAVRLRFEPSRAETRRYAMRIQAGRELAITNINYRGVMDFEEQSEAFTAFVTAFHEALHAANPDATYRAGSTMGAYIGNVILNVFVLSVLIGVAIWLITTGMWGIFAVKAAIILFYVPVMLIQLKKNFPKSYNPDDIPTDLKPA